MPISHTLLEMSSKLHDSPLPLECQEAEKSSFKKALEYF